MYCSWDNQPIKSPQGLSPIAVSSITGDGGSNIPTYPGNVNFAKRTKSPPLPSHEEDILGLYSPPDANARRSAVPSSWENLPNQPSSSYVRSPQRLTPVAARKNAHDTEANFSMKPDSFNFAIRTRSPPLPTHEDDILGLYNPPNVNARRLSPPPSLSRQPEGQVSLPSANNQRLSPVAAYGNAHGAVANFRTYPIGLHVAKKAKSPPLPSHENNSLEMNNHSIGNDRRIDDPSKRTGLSPATGSHSVQNLEFSDDITRRHDVSPPRMRSRRRSPVSAAGPFHQMAEVIASDAGTSSPVHPAYHNPIKRARSHPLKSADVNSTSSSIQLDSEREMQAKARRLARFNVELSQPLQTPDDITKRKFSGNKHDKAPSDEHNSNCSPAIEAWDTSGAVTDYEVMGSSKVVVGQCRDMCPEPEREERERKGDLDKFERLDGERNQTTKFLAVKKYNRTAEREAELIRPLPVLRHTVDYLLNLLDQPYGESFLGIYNFLWDRMRAVRMDLRMQHIFNREAILMLEQMIRLHIIAMHELCEYKKGEGFMEGFDAHLNIEQMNKTSVELFQIYEDYRKKGKSVPTEKEFRGYYALLKLDKHPGYKVEPAELSLDLAKMTPEMRCTPEILFARNVARSCRIGNFIAFFRLARKATYLQACLMHAHFAKLRTQALASLHSGLQNNQGIPVSHVVKWLGMEGEDIDSLLEYHGFSLRRYKELYMVKEGPFLNSDADYPTTCSRLVHLKKSRSIIDDVKSGPAVSEPNEDRKTESITEVSSPKINSLKREGWTNGVNKNMLEPKVDLTPRVVSEPQYMCEAPSPTIWNRKGDSEVTDVSPAISNVETDREMAEASSVKATCLFDDNSVIDQEQPIDKDEIVESVGIDEIVEVNMVQAEIPVSSNLDLIAAHSVPHMDVEENLENEVSKLVPNREDEAFSQKLKSILRKWKERSSVLRKIREQREFLADVALSSLTIGPPVRQQISGEQAHAAEQLNMDHVTIERSKKLRNLQERLNVAELVSPILCRKNPDSKCIIWKLVVQTNDTGSQTYNLALKWLSSKIMGSDMITGDNLLVSQPGLSIWKKWTHTQSSLSQVCCLSILGLADNHHVCEDGLLAGLSCLLFLASGSISWDIQSVQLQKLLTSIPSGASMPLLILCPDSYEENSINPSVAMINRLGLDKADRTKISSLSTIFLHSRSQSEYPNILFDDARLKEGLQWLADHSPPQPVLQLVNTRELALRYLRQSIAKLDNTKGADIGPNDCILAFNEALDCSAKEIIAAASTNPNNWPSPEINLLKKSNDERLATETYLPCIGWSSPERIEPIINTINACKLPSWASEMSWLNQGSSSVKELQNQKLATEEIIINYLTESTRLLNYDLAVKEARVMLQKGAGLERRGSYHYIVLRWVEIFRRIYNWQLMKFKGNKYSEAYVLAHEDESDTESQQPLHSVRTDISLDELMDISFDSPSTDKPISVFKPSPEIFYGGSLISETNIICNGEGEDHDSVNIPSTVYSNELKISPGCRESISRFNKVLEECIRLQDGNARGLFPYFE
ncbi:SAC3 family protein B isoform X2 [Asparagus officinalis]|nr:SAC3 family protein B isoform X2 [Asparagus officinalis]